jgi:hypothetical protein
MKNATRGKMVFTLAGVGLLMNVLCLGISFTLFSFTLETTGGTGAESDIAKNLTVESRLVGTHTVEYIEETVTETEYVYVVKSVPVELRNFINLEELEKWLHDREDTNIVRFQQTDKVLDCDDFAFELQRKALEDGYITSFEIIGRSEYNELFKTTMPPEQSLHAINLAIIGNNVYYIEPQTDEIVLAAYMD